MDTNIGFHHSINKVMIIKAVWAGVFIVKWRPFFYVVWFLRSNSLIYIYIYILKNKIKVMLGNIILIYFLHFDTIIFHIEYLNLCYWTFIKKTNVKPLKIILRASWVLVLVPTILLFNQKEVFMFQAKR